MEGYSLQRCGSHLENVCLQDVMAELHGLLAVQLALLSREHECQESMPVPRTRNTQVGNQRPEFISLQALGANIAPRPLNCSPGASASPNKTGGRLLLHRRWSMLFIPRVILRAFSGFLCLCGVTQREASGQGRSLKMEPPAPCSSSITLSSVYLLI